MRPWSDVSPLALIFVLVLMPMRVRELVLIGDFAAIVLCAGEFADSDGDAAVPAVPGNRRCYVPRALDRWTICPNR